MHMQNIVNFIMQMLACFVYSGCSQARFECRLQGAEQLSCL